MYIATVYYQIGTYEGEIKVNSNEDCHEYIIQRAKRILRKKTTLVMFSEYYEVINIEEY